MLKMLADNRDTKSFAVKFRRKRFAFFKSLLAQLERPVNLLDIGGTETYWKTMGLTEDDEIHITLLNVFPSDVSLTFLKPWIGDARKIEAEDQSFDVVFSNSVIEHVGNIGDQEQMAREVRRVGKRYFVQTPNKYFPLEPHFLFPFFQFLPLGVRIWLLRNFNLGWIARTPDPTEARRIVESIRLLDRQELLAQFPNARIYEEKLLGLTKSFVAYDGWDQ